MADEIYVNIGTTFQQPYQGTAPANGRTPVTARQPRQAIANAQNPFTYANQQPSIYQNPVNAQSPYIANAQQPYPYIVNANYPYIANQQQPYPYIANSQSPYIANARQPSTYARQGRTPFTYSRQGRYPATYQHQIPSTYERQGQMPYTRQESYQNPFTYATQGRSPYPANAQQPYEYQANRQTTYQHTARQPAPYIVNHQNVAQQPASYRHPSIGTTPINVNATYQQPYPFTYQVTYQNSVRGPINVPLSGTYQVSYRTPQIVQQPVSYQSPVPSTYTYDRFRGEALFFMTSYPSYTASFYGYSSGFGIAMGSSLGQPASGQPIASAGYTTYPWAYLPFVATTPSNPAGYIMLYQTPFSQYSNWTFSWSSFPATQAPSSYQYFHTLTKVEFAAGFKTPSSAPTYTPSTTTYGNTVTVPVGVPTSAYNWSIPYQTFQPLGFSYSTYAFQLVRMRFYD